MIIGGPGSGKSHLADVLAARTGLPVFRVDDAVWDADGNVRPPFEIDRRVRAMIDRPRWIIEGGNTRTYGDRARRADAVVLLSPPRWLRFWRVLRRDGLLRPGVLRWTLRYDGTFSPANERAVANTPGDVHVVRTRKDLSALLTALPPRSAHR